MKQNFTPDDLIKYLYNETSASETLAINEALCEDRELFEEFAGLHQAYHQLPKVKFNPSGSSIQNILKYSEYTAVEKHA